MAEVPMLKRHTYDLEVVLPLPCVLGSRVIALSGVSGVYEISASSTRMQDSARGNLMADLGAAPA